MSTSFLPITKKIFSQVATDEPIPHIMLVDMNSFFASVEQQANPKFRGHPLGVVASMHDTSCLIAASKEAKALGIKTGTLIYKAKQICPEIILVPAEPEKYREVNRNMVKIFLDYTDSLEVYSIDEAFLDLSEPMNRLTTKNGVVSSFMNSNPLLIGAEIKRRIKDEVGEWLTCNVGIAPNKFMAKLAADLQKPDGLSVVWRSNLPEIYRELKFTDLWGIARGWQRRLNALGINSPLEFLTYPVANLLAIFGKPGFYIWQRLQGLEQDEIRSVEDAPKSFGHSWVLNFRTRDKSKLAPVIMRLAEKAARRMRRERFVASSVYLGVADVAGNYFHVSKRLHRTISTGQELYAESLQLWKNWKFNFEIMHIATGFRELLADCHQLDLFGNERARKLTSVLDAINDRYGEFTIRSGLLINSYDYAPDAIAFGK